MSSAIIDKFIPESVFPNEEILCWIKYEGNSIFDSIQFSYIDDNNLVDFHFKNIIKDVSIKKEEKKKIVNLLRKEFTLDGFFCFTCKYSYLEVGKKILSFFIELQLNGITIESTILNIEVIRPLLELGEEKIKSLFIPSSTESELKPIKLNIYNSGSAEAIKTELKFESSNDNVHVEIKSYERHKIDRGFFKRNIIYKDISLQVSGMGEAVIKVNAEYYDHQGNFYKDTLETFNIVSNTNEMTEIPLIQPVVKSTPNLDKV